MEVMRNFRPPTEGHITDHKTNAEEMKKQKLDFMHIMCTTYIQ